MSLAEQITDALQRGDIPSAKGLLSSRSFMTPTRVASHLIRSNQKDILKMAIDNGIARISYAEKAQAAGVSLDMFMFATRHCNDDRGGDSEALGKAAGAGLIDVLEHLKEFGTQPFYLHASIAAIENDQLAALQWLEKNLPKTVSYGYRRGAAQTFECLRYIHSRGHMPCYDDYKNAVLAGDNEYAEWLRGIKCPGTFEITEVPEDVEDRFRYGPLDPGDIPWVLKLASARKLPEPEKMGWTPAIFRIFGDLLKRAADQQTREYLFRYAGDKSFERYLDMEDMTEWLVAHPQEIPANVAALKLAPHKLAELFLHVDDAADDTDDNPDYEDRGKSYLRHHLESLVDWTEVFTAELINRCEWEGRSTNKRYVEIIDGLWDKYEDKLPHLQSVKNKQAWIDLASREDLEDLDAIEIDDLVNEIIGYR